MWPQVKAEELQRRDYLAIHLQLSAVPPLLSFQLALHLLLLTLHPRDAQPRAGRVVRQGAYHKQMLKNIQFKMDSKAAENFV